MLENLGPGAGIVGHQLLDDCDFLNDETTRFFQIHFHEALPHGDQIVNALGAAPLQSSEIADLVTGAEVGAIMYLRGADWALKRDELTVGAFTSM